MSKCIDCGELFRVNEDYRDHLPCPEAAKKMPERTPIQTIRVDLADFNDLCRELQHMRKQRDELQTNGTVLIDFGRKWKRLALAALDGWEKGDDIVTGMEGIRSEAAKEAGE